MRNHSRPTALLHALFFLSGAVALIYEVVWTRWLTGLLGSESAATAAIVSAEVICEGKPTIVVEVNPAPTATATILVEDTTGIRHCGKGQIAIVTQEFISFDTKSDTTVRAVGDEEVDQTVVIEITRGTAVAILLLCILFAHLETRPGELVPECLTTMTDIKGGWFAMVHKDQVEISVLIQV